MLLQMRLGGRRSESEGTDQSSGFAEAPKPGWSACDPVPSSAPDDGERWGPFGYFFADAPDPGPVPRRTAHLDALAMAMVEDRPSPEDNSRLPPVFTYLAQFIDHDVTADVDRDIGRFASDSAELLPVSRASVSSSLRNPRNGALRLDSLYGTDPSSGDGADGLLGGLRSPAEPAKFWLGSTFDAGLGRSPRPADGGDDLLRLGDLLRGPQASTTEAEIRALPEGLHAGFLNPDGSLRVQKAIIGEGRNDRNLFLAQLHLVLQRLHNRVVDAASDHGGPFGDEDALFHWAREQTTRIYQWLVVNVYLPTVCDPGIVRRVIAERAPLYAGLLRRRPVSAGGAMPVPLEFSLAAGRFGRSMVRASYDWSHLFGRAECEGARNLLPGAPAELLSACTGSADLPMPLPDGSSAPRLPSHCLPDWGRLVAPVTDALPDRATRSIDTRLALPPDDLQPDDPIGDEGLDRMARQTLRQGYRLGLPTAQACLAGLAATGLGPIRWLGEAELTSGATGAAVRRGGFEVATPLWFYVLKEAEILGHGNRLGPLGSRLVAETLVGLVIHDRRSYWHCAGSDSGRWHPRDGVRPAGEPVESLPALLRAAGVL